MSHSYLYYSITTVNHIFINRASSLNATSTTVSQTGLPVGMNGEFTSSTRSVVGGGLVISQNKSSQLHGEMSRASFYEAINSHSATSFYRDTTINSSALAASATSATTNGTSSTAAPVNPGGQQQPVSRVQLEHAGKSMSPRSPEDGMSLSPASDSPIVVSIASVYVYGIVVGIVSVCVVLWSVQYIGGLLWACISLSVQCMCVLYCGQCVSVHVNYGIADM